MRTIAFVFLSFIVILSAPTVSLFRCAGSCRTPILSKGEPEKSQTSDMQLLKNGSSGERMFAARRLGEAKDKNAIPVLIEALNDPNQYVRGEAACSLGEIGSMDAVDPLIEVLFKCSHRFLTVKGPS